MSDLAPPFRWPGGKRRLAARVIALLGPDGMFIDPFVGAGGLIYPLRAGGYTGPIIAADVNPRVVGVHRWIRDGADDVTRALAALPEDWRAAYNDVRAEFNASDPRSLASAVRLIWLQAASFNGLYRVNAAGEYNAPIGDRAELRLPTAAHLLDLSRALVGVELLVADFEAVIGLAGAGDRLYCDPPYLSDGAAFTAYAGAFGPNEHLRLYVAAGAAARRGARVVVSNAASARAAALHDLIAVPPLEADVHRLRVNRSISCGERTAAAETLTLYRLAGEAP